MKNGYKMEKIDIKCKKNFKFGKNFIIEKIIGKIRPKITKKY